METHTKEDNASFIPFKYLSMIKIKVTFDINNNNKYTNNIHIYIYIYIIIHASLLLNFSINIL